MTITTVPILSKELRTVYPFLGEVLGPQGVLAGKEVYAYLPNTITVVAGDTIRFEFINPEDDAHGFVLPHFAVSLPGKAITHAEYVAPEPGIYTFNCSVQAHLPSMTGQLVVLAPEAVQNAAPTLAP